MSKQIKCKVCKRRLFDIGPYLIGGMQIKCPECKTIMNIDFTPTRFIMTCKAE